MSERPGRHEVLSWSDVEKLIDLLVPQIRTFGAFDSVLMITRGGIIPGGMLAEALDIKNVLTAAVDFPASDTALMAWPTFLQYPENALLTGRYVLVVDDVWGSGRTSTAVRERAIAAGATVYTCVLHYNPYRSLFTKAKPDFFGAATDSYIVYPWEIDRGLRNLSMGMPEAN